MIVGSGHRDTSITESLSANIAAVAIADPGYQWADALPGGYPTATARIPECADAGGAPVGRTGTVDRQCARPGHRAHRRRRRLAARGVARHASADALRHRDRRRYRRDAGAAADRCC